jgi:hypothetical protein
MITQTIFPLDIVVEGWIQVVKAFGCGLVGLFIFWNSEKESSTKWPLPISHHV